MAEEELELDVNEKKKKSPILLIIILLVVINGGGIGAWLFLSGGDKGAGSAEKHEEVKGPLIYRTMVPEFIINFGPDSRVRYLQVDLQIATRDKAAIAIVDTYRPVLRNDILVVLSNVKFEDLRERSGKEALQQRLLNTINKVVIAASHAAPAKNSKDGGHGGGGNVKGPIENVYFTNFIMQ